MSRSIAPCMVILCLVVGCGTNKIYRISSDPPGAVVGSGSVVYGTTPFTTDLNTILPHRAYDAKIAASRRLTFTKDGYLSGTAVITEFGKAGAVHVVLQPAFSTDQPGRAPQQRSIEFRLSEAKRLRDEGFITEEEYQAKRQEILNGL